MLHNSFLITNNNLTVKLNKTQQATLSRLFKLYKPNSYIYPGVLIRELNIEMRAAYTILDLLKEQGYLQELYEIYCPYESKSIGITYDNLLNLVTDEEIKACPECGQEINIKRNNILIYKLLHQVNIVYGE